MEKKNRYLLYSIFYASLLLIAIGIYTYGYNPPTCNPPGCNLPAPINAGLDPQTKAGNLTIQGNLTTGGFTMSAGAGADKVLTTNASGVATWQTPAGGSLWTQTGNDIYYNAGNVGIGATSPDTARLKISGGVLDMTSQKITNLATPTASTDAATKGYVDSKKACGFAITFTYKGSNVIYGTVLNPDTGECWMDRNLGASQVATTYNDSLAYGDLFQWGRLDDGHQTRTSGITITRSSTDNPGHSNFILAPGSPFDWRSPQNNNLWQGVSGINNPCPPGWRIPTESEWEAERLSWTGGNNYSGAFGSSLKLTAGGSRDSSDGWLSSVGSKGYYWSSAVGGTYARRLYFYGAGALMSSYSRADGFSVRCVQD